jgi:hypothetical protein
MAATFVVYIDESGDEGFAFSEGSSEWFILSGVVTRKAKDLATLLYCLQAHVSRLLS